MRFPTGTAVDCVDSSGSGSPGGANPQLQYNNAGSFGGVANSGADSNGNVGLGTLTPTAILDISSTANQDLFRVNDNGTGDVSPFIINQDGNVGIGSASPGRVLDIYGASPIIRVIPTANSQTSSFLMTAIDGLVRGGITSNISTGEIRMGALASGGGYFPTIWSGQSERMRITTTGNVGIATSTPVALLDISSTANQNLFMVNDNGSGDDSPFLVDAAGNVGIGTATALANLHTTGGVGGTNIFKFERVNGATGFISGNVSGGDPQMLFDANAGTTQWAMGHVSGTDDFRITNGSAIRTGGSDRFVINSSGNVGIGTFNPLASLHINAAGSSFRINSSGNIAAIGGNTSATISSSTVSFAPTTMTVQNNSSTAGSRLNVIGSNAATGRLDLQSTSGVGSGDLIRFLTGNAGGTVAGAFNTAGNLGLGTITPGNKLVVVGGIGVDDTVGGAYTTVAAPSGGANIKGNVSIGTTASTGTLTIGNPAIGNGGLTPAIAVTSNSNTPIYVGNSDSDRAIMMGYKGNDIQGRLVSGANADLELQWVAATNLGIGTSGPRAKVEVEGQVRINDLNTGANPGTSLCYDANNNLCACGTCA